jgi:multiple sugar transport system substrate-binding protein
MLAGSLAGCGSGSSDAATSDIPEKGTDDGSQIVVWIRSDKETQAQHMAKAYNASHKNQVKLELIPSEEMEGKVGSASQTDTLPDLLAGDVVRINYWASEGIFTDATKLIDNLPNIKDIQTGHIDAGTVDGSKYTLPLFNDTSIMAWNKDLYKKAGLDPEDGPTTIAKFEKQAKAVAALNESGVSGSYFGGQCGGADVFMLFPMIWADGQEVMNDDGTKSLMEGSTAKAIFSAYRNLANTKNGLGDGSKEENCATWTSGFENGKVAAQPFPSTSLNRLIKQEKEGGFKFGVTAIAGTKESDGSTFLGGDAIGMSKDSKKTAQAWNFLQWLMTEDAQQKVFADNGDIASNLKVLQNGYKDADARVQIINATIKNGRTPVSTHFNEAFNAAGSPWQLLLQDQIWGNASKLSADNQAITTALAGDE